MRNFIFVLVFIAIGLNGHAQQHPKKPFQPNMGPDLPAITVHAGDISILLRQESQWTPGRIDFQKIPMTTERSAYGTVFSFPEIGFIGTSHLENEPEDLQSLEFIVDGKKVESPTAIIAPVDSFQFKRRSKIRDFDLENTIEIHDNRLYETATIHTAKDTPLKLVYHFMHAWKPSMSEYLAHSKEKIISGELNDLKESHRKFFINSTVRWTALFDPESNQFAVSKVLASPSLTKNESTFDLEGKVPFLENLPHSSFPTARPPSPSHSSKIWNVPGTYRKYYLTSFQNQTVPAGFRGTWKMVTAFGKSTPENWKSDAEVLVRQLFDDPAQRPEGLKFTAMGCGPYTVEDEEALRKLLRWENENPTSDFIIHCGDIVTGKVKDWPESQYEKIASLLKTNNQIPTFVVPGDNEWNDQEDPDRHWGYWEKHFLHFDKNWPAVQGASPVERQDVRPENFTFTKDKVVFIGINKVGGMIHDAEEWETRLTQSAKWIHRQLFSQRETTHSAVIFAQAGGFSKIGDFQKYLARIGAEYEKPILYLHADGHKWSVDPEKYAPNITRVQLDVVNGQFPPIQVTVTGDPVTPFHFDRRLRLAE